MVPSRLGDGYRASGQGSYHASPGAGKEQAQRSGPFNGARGTAYQIERATRTGLGVMRDGRHEALPRAQEP